MKSPSRWNLGRQTLPVKLDLNPSGVEPEAVATSTDQEPGLLQRLGWKRGTLMSALRTEGGMKGTEPNGCGTALVSEKTQTRDRGSSRVAQTFSASVDVIMMYPFLKRIM